VLYCEASLTLDVIRLKATGVFVVKWYNATNKYDKAVKAGWATRLFNTPLFNEQGDYPGGER
jgi:hypothetical protein